jgi:hypothetical protein
MAQGRSAEGSGVCRNWLFALHRGPNPAVPTCAEIQGSGPKELR